MNHWLLSTSKRKIKKLGKKNLPHAWITAKPKPPGTYSLSDILNIIWMAGLIKTELWLHLVCITRSIVLCVLRRLFFTCCCPDEYRSVTQLCSRSHCQTLIHFLDPLWQKDVMNKFVFSVFDPLNTNIKMCFTEFKTHSVVKKLHKGNFQLSEGCLSKFSC